MHDLTAIQRQMGASLIVALVFLAILTIAGITAARFATMEERMASNSQFRGQTYQNAQSEIRSQIASFNENLAKRVPLLQAANNALDATTKFPERRTQADLTTVMTGASITSNKIRFMSKGLCEGASVGRFECSAYEIDTESRLSNGAYSNQTQGIYFLNLK
ncbi:hypothetical protein D9M70_364940 [compost metagenome]